MSIADLEQKLALVLAKHISADGLHSTLPPPHRLIKRLDIIERRFDTLENDQPAIEKVRLAIEKLERDGRIVLTQRDWKNVAWGLCATLPNRSQKLIFKPTGREVLQAFQDKQANLTTSVYRALLSGYFAVTRGELQQDSNHWLVLRDLLDQSRLTIQQQSKRPKSWMQPLNDYPELLRTQPTKRLAVDFVDDPDDQKILQLTDTLNIIEGSWFWESLTQQAVKSVCELPDAQFLSKIDRLLHLMTKRPTYTQLILSSTLDRYAQSAQRDQAHEQLKVIVLTQWGNPQYESSAGWLNVKPDTKQMVIQWFVHADLEAFFIFFSQTADERRFQYWMRFIKQISYSQIFLGRNALYSRRTDQQDFISSNKGRLFELIGGSSSNNSFMLKIGNLYIAEFSETGNACYLYNRMPFEHSSRTTFSLTDDLKNKSKPPFICTLKHTHSWEERFDEKLAQLGIFPDGNAKKNPTSATGYRRM
jgi:hypothetical protein